MFNLKHITEATLRLLIITTLELSRKPSSNRVQRRQFVFGRIIRIYYSPKQQFSEDTKMASRSNRRKSSKRPSMVSIEVFEQRALLSGDSLGELQSPYTQIILALENPDGSASNETFVIYEEKFDQQWVDGGWLWEGQYGGQMVLPSQAYMAYDHQWINVGPDEYAHPGTYEKLQVVSHQPAPASIQPGGDWENLRAYAEELKSGFVPPVTLAEPELQPLMAPSVIDMTDPDWLLPPASVVEEWVQHQLALGFQVSPSPNLPTTTVADTISNDSAMNSLDSGLSSVLDWAPAGADPGSLDFLGINAPVFLTPVDLTPTESVSVEYMPVPALTNGPTDVERPWGVSLETWNQMHPPVELILDEASFPVAIYLPETLTTSWESPEDLSPVMLTLDVLPPVMDMPVETSLAELPLMTPELLTEESMPVIPVEAVVAPLIEISVEIPPSPAIPIPLAGYSVPELSEPTAEPLSYSSDDAYEMMMQSVVSGVSDSSTPEYDPESAPIEAGPSDTSVSGAGLEQATLSSLAAVSIPANSGSSNLIDWSSEESSPAVPVTFDTEEESAAYVTQEEDSESLHHLASSDLENQTINEPETSGNSSLDPLEGSLLTSEV